jgi:hypothetical protein
VSPAKPATERTPNHALRAARLAMKLSLDEFAKAVQQAGSRLGEPNQCSKHLVYRWETGAVRSCRFNYRRALETLTGKTYTELGFIELFDQRHPDEPATHAPALLPATKRPNTALRAAMTEHELTVEGLAKALDAEMARQPGAPDHYTDARHIRRWLAGDTLWPWTRYHEPLTRIFGRPLIDLGFVPRSDRRWTSADEYQASAVIMSSDIARTIEMLSSLAESPMERRNFVLTSGAALIIPAHHWLLNPDHGERLAGALNGRPVTGSTVHTIEEIINDQRRVADSIPIDAALPSLQGSLGTVIRLLKNSSYTEDVGARLYAASSELARMIGWLHYENGALDTARAQFATAFQAARTARDRALAAYTLQMLATVETKSGDPRHAIVLLQTAQTGARGSLTQRHQALVHAGLARAYGALRDAKAAGREAEDSTSAINEASGEQDPPYLHWVDAAELAGTNGQAFRMAGALQPARHYLEQALGQFDATLPRDRALYTMYLAETLLAQGEIEHACATASQAADTAETIGGGRLATELNSFINSLTPHRRETAAAALIERAHSLT